MFVFWMIVLIFVSSIWRKCDNYFCYLGQKIKWHQCVMWSCVVSWILMSRRRDKRQQKYTGKVKENIAVIVLKFRKPILKKQTGNQGS